MLPAFHGHGFIIEQNADLPVPLAPSAHTPPFMAECMDALSTLPPIPSCDIAAMGSLSTDEMYQMTWSDADASYSYTSTSASDYGLGLSPNEPLDLATFPEELMYPQDSVVDQGAYTQDSFEFQYYSQ